MALNQDSIAEAIVKSTGRNLEKTSNLFSLHNYKNKKGKSIEMNFPFPLIV
jgi:hypothetical protein